MSNIINLEEEMGKNKKEPVDYVVNMDITISDLSKMPPDTTPATLFMDACIGAVIRVSKQSNGLSMQEQRRLYSLRETLRQATVVKETDKVIVTEEDFKFLWKCWNNQRPEATINELLMRVEVNLKQAQDERNKKIQSV